MKKDIQIPKVKNVYLAIVPEYNETFKSDDWNVYIINENNTPIEMILILSKGFDNKKETAQMRHKIDVLPAKSGIKFELMIEEVLSLNNEFKITYFKDSQLFDKIFLAKKNSIKKSNTRLIKALDKRGVVLK